jgi:hypothetical protein
MAKKEQPPPKPCQTCKVNEANPGERFCRDCKRAALDRMKNDGYFTESPRTTPHEMRGRPQRSTQMLGGEAEMNDAGDD